LTKDSNYYRDKNVRLRRRIKLKIRKLRVAKMQKAKRKKRKMKYNCPNGGI
jgi:hypothetical protein